MDGFRRFFCPSYTGLNTGPLDARGEAASYKEMNISSQNKKKIKFWLVE